MNRLLVVELVGPLIDDRGVISRTAAKVLRQAGVELPSRAFDQTAGGGPRWALETLLGGHGRDDLGGRLPELAGELTRNWKELVATGEMSQAPGAARWLEAVTRSGQEFVVFSQLARETAEAAARAAGLTGLVGRIVEAAPPDPSLIGNAIAERGGGRAVAALVSSPAGVLATSGARIGEVVLVGLANPSASALPVDRWVGAIDEVTA
jgi:beta-phosphoglucomutase-like phosphatase (HAD superfamily)